MAKFIEPSATIITPANCEEGIAMLRFIENFSRISHRSEDRMTLDSWRRFISFVVLEKGDWSVTEHVNASVVMRISRGITHELVRHRIASYTQESTRFVNYGKREGEMEFILPSDFIKKPGDPWTNEELDARRDFEEGCQNEEARYLRQIARGVKPQVARDGLPHALASTIAVTMNLRSWHQILSIRTTRETHPDFRRVTEPLLQEFKTRVPILFENIIAGRKQSEAMAVNR